MQKLSFKIIVLFLSLIISCTSIENNIEENNENDVIKIATEKYGDKFNLNYNLSKEFVICLNSSKSMVASGSTIKYFIYSISNNKIIEENFIPLGNISWVSEFEVKVEIFPGMIQKNVQPDVGYILNVKTNSKNKIDGGVH